MSARTGTALERAVAQYLDVALPSDAAYFGVPNGGSRGRTEAAILKACGVKTGVPDVVVIWRGQALGIELKAGSGQLTKAQRERHAELNAAGMPVQVCRDVASVQAWLESQGIALRAKAQQEVPV